MTAQQPYALQNSSHSAALFRSAVHSPWLGPGVVAPGEYAVTAQSTPNMSVQVAGGRAWMKGTQVSNVSGQQFSTQSSYFGLNDAPVTVTIATANATNPRIDLVYVAVNDSFYSGTNNNCVVGVVTGTPAASPVAPAAPSNSLTLATVAVAANATSITNSNIAQAAAGSLLTVARGGIDPCLSTNRPTTGLYGGYPIYETDTGLVKVYTGTTWATVTPNAPDTAWTNVSSLANGWVNFGAGYPVPRYRKLSNGQVEIQGMIKSGSVNTSTPVFTLPSGYRPLVPGAHLIFPTSATDLYAEMRIDNSGGVYAWNGTVTGWFYLSGIFFAEQ